MADRICESKTCQQVIENVVPALGCIPFLYVIVALLPDVRRIEKERSIGTMNVLLYPMIVWVSNSCMMYGMLLNDYYIYVTNCIELGLSL
jgi:ABC-type methionine transport system permease subunit